MSSKVLVVEDDEAIRVAVAAFLEAEGYEVISAANGEEGLEYLKNSGPPKLILVDLMMPGMTGEEFFQTLKTLDDPISRVPTIAFSAIHELPKRAAELGFYGYLKKPVEIELFEELLRRFPA